MASDGALDTPPPAARDTGLVRAWAWLALLQLAAAVLGAAYQAGFTGRDPAFDAAARPAFVALIDLALAMVVGWPLSFVGLRLARGLGWGAPWLAGARPLREAALPLAFALCLGVCADAVMHLLGAGVDALWPHALAAPHALHVRMAPWKGVLGGPAAGINEEIAMRLVLMSALARLFARLGGTPGRATRAHVWAANALAALAFGALHFSNMAALHIPFTFAWVTWVLAMNGLLGLLCGWLYVRYGLEAAIVAHAAAGLFGHGVYPALRAVR